jgi:aryl-alcohol dehydrogenase-like predicted oxidoreductase
MRALGKSGIEIPPVILGGNVFGWTVDEATSFNLLDAALAAGINCIDTADMYSRWVPGHQGGESETIIGKWMKLRGNRNRVIIATKVGMEMGPGKKGLSRAYILKAAEDSLARLQTDHIDLYQSHEDDAGTPQAETLGTYEQLVKQGKVRAIGASNFNAARLGEALTVSAQHAYPAYQCLQPHYNLCERSDYETKLEPVCLKHGLGVIPYFPLAAGFLSGKYRTEADLSKSRRGAGLRKYLNDRGLKILHALDRVALERSSSPAAVALAWIMQRPSISAPIASVTTPEQLNTLIEATQLKLDAASVDALNSASA